MSTDLRKEAAGYLRLRRSLGYRLIDHDWLIASFLDHVENQGHSRITVEDALAFAQATAASRPWQARRLAVVRGLAVYVHSCDPAAAQLIPPDLIHASRVRRRVPYLYTSEQVAALMAQATTLSPPILAATMSTLVGLMAVTGMRTCEARRIDVEDLDIARRVLAVTGKGGKRRLLPLDASTVASLVNYLRLRANAVPTSQVGPLLVGRRGGRLNKGTVQAAFRQVAGAVGLVAPVRPRRGYMICATHSR